MAIASGHRRSALRALPAAPAATFVEMGCAWYRTPHMWLRIRRLLLSLSRFSYPASLGTLIGVRRQGLVSWSTFRVLRTGGRATSFSFARGSLFPPLREMSFRSGLWLLSAQLAPRCCRPGLRLVHHDIRSFRRVLGVVYGGFFRWGDQAAYWQSPNSSSSSLLSGCPRRRAVFFLCSPAGGGFFPLIPFTALFGGHAARPPALFLCGSSKE